MKEDIHFLLCTSNVWIFIIGFIGFVSLKWSEMFINGIFLQLKTELNSPQKYLTALLSNPGFTLELPRAAN